MPEVWIPGLIHDPGDSAGYGYGRNEMRLACVHCTAGRNSYELVKWGGSDRASLSAVLLPKVGTPWQFCEIDALTHDSPPNNDGPGFEIERMSAGVMHRWGLSGWEDLTPDQTYWMGVIVYFLNEEWGMPINLYDGENLGRHHGGIPGYHGFANHGDIDNQRSDGVTPEEWAAIVNRPPSEEEELVAIKDELLGTLGVWEQETRAYLREEIRNVAFVSAFNVITELTKRIPELTVDEEEVKEAVKAAIEEASSEPPPVSVPQLT
jgi:hypothetical protein